jgi:alpha-glucosidase
VGFLYPEDSSTLAIQAQFFFGSSILVSHVTIEKFNRSHLYQPEEQLYDFWAYEPIRDLGARTTLSDVNYTQIPVCIKGDSIVPTRVDGADTTTALRALDFNLIVAPGLLGNASGSLYLDDGISIDQAATSLIEFEYTGTSLGMSGTFNYDAGVKIANIFF